MLDTYSFRELTFFADKSQFTMISVTKQNLVINLEWQEAEPSDRYKSCPSSKLHLHSSLFFFFFYSSLLLLSLRNEHIIFPREYTSTGSIINISIDIWSGKKKFDAYRKSSHQLLFYFSNHLFVYGNIKVKIIFNLTNQPLIMIRNSIQIYIRYYFISLFAPV